MHCALHAGKTAAVVKADAYGLGASTVAPALARAGCDTFFVAMVEEGEALRRDLPGARILVFEGATEATAHRLAAADLVPVINGPEQLAAWRAHAARPIAVHVDTGIGRLGFDCALHARTFSGFSVMLLLTHLACADAPQHAQNERQLEAFHQVARLFPGVPTSIGNSAGMRLGSQYCGDVARPGIGLYADPGGSCVACLEGQVLQVREHPAQTPLGYGATYTTQEKCRVATVGLGYADGVRRALSNRGAAAVGEMRCPIVGRVSMDLTLVDVTRASATPGDWIEFFGPRVAVAEVADWAQTIAYEILTGIGPRVERVYINPT